MTTYGSLFAGIGGFDLGFDRAGLECAWQVECDRNCNRILERHWPTVTRYSDVREVTATGLVRPDLLIGGFPCQDLSVAGRRAGLAGERSGLFYEFARIIGELSPSGFVIENVPGLLSSADGRDFFLLLYELAKLGYGFAYRILDAQYFGVAQRRRRVLIVGCLGDWRRAAEILFESESLPWDSAPRRETGAGVAGTIAAGTHASGFNGRDAECGRIIARSITTREGQRMGCCQDTFVTHALSSEGADASEDGTGRGTPIIAYRTSCNCGVMEQGDKTAALNCGTDPNQNIVAYQCHGSNVGPMGHLRAGNGNETGGVPFTFDPRQVTSKENRTAINLDGPSSTLHELPQAVAFQTRIARNGRGQPKETVDALVGSESGVHGDSKPHVAGAFGVRRLTPRECERLQGFPDDFTRWDSEGNELADSPRYRMLGNAVAVPVAEWIGRRILAAQPRGRA